MLRKLCIIIQILTLAAAFAGDDGPTKVPQEISASAPSYAEQALRENSVTLLLTSGILPTEPFVSSPRAYTLVPISVGASWTLDNVSNDDVAFGWFRGNTSLVLTPFYYDVTHGPESRFVGLTGGPQYNFIQKGWNAVPFIGSKVGFGFCDSGNSGHVPYDMGQDFCFTFGVEAGVQYFFNKNWSLIGKISYQHFSNAGLSEPARQNTGLDLLGPQVSLGYTF